MADEIDIANDRAQIDLENLIAAARSNVPHQDGPANCVECEEAMPEPRRRLGYSLCVPCASERERIRALHAGGMA